MAAYLRFVLSHRALVIAFCGIVTLVAGWSLSRAVVATSIGRLFLGESPAYQAYLARGRTFETTDEVVVVGLEDPEVLSPTGQDRLRGVVEGLRAHPEVARVQSILDAVHLAPGPLGPRPVAYAAEAAAAPARLGEITRALQEDPLYRGLLVADDGQSSVVVVELTQDPERSGEKAPELVAAVIKQFTAQGYPRERLHLAGFVATSAEIMAQTDYNLRRLTPLIAVVLLFTVWLMFRRLWPAAISLGIALLGVVWTLGFAVQLDPQLNVLTATAPGLILIVSFSDVVHLCSAYLLELDQGLEQGPAIESSGAEVGRACFLTSLTTLVGFMCLSLIPTPLFRNLGVVLGFGVAISLVLALTLVPIILSLMGRPKPLRGGSTAWVHRGLDRLLAGMQRLALGSPRTTIAVSLAFTALCLAAVPRLNIESDFSKRVGPDNPLRQDQAWFQAHYLGSNIVDVYVQPQRPELLRDPAWFARLAAFQEEVAALPAVDSALSIVDAVRLLRQAAGQAEPLPPDAASLQGAYAALGLGAGDALRRLVSFEEGTLRVAVRLSDQGFRTTSALGLEVVALGRKTLGAETTVEPTGLSYLLGDWLDEIVAGQRDGLLFSVATIALMLAIGFRSLRLGLGSMLPNLLPLLALGGWLGWFWDAIDSDTFIVAAVAIGIGVDDTIHFLSRYQVEARRRADTAEALRHTYAFAGRAIVMTTVILVLGFLPFATSDYYSTWMLGSFLPLCLIVAVLADLLLLPAMIQIGWLKEAGPADSAEAAPQAPISGDAPHDPPA